MARINLNVPIKAALFENSLPCGSADFTESAALPPCTCLLQAGLRQTRRLQVLGITRTY